MNVAPRRHRYKLKACGLEQDLARAPHVNLPRVKMDLNWYERYVQFRQLFETMAIIATTPADKPIPIPARRRRKDREIPRAASSLFDSSLFDRLDFLASLEAESNSAA
jgi:hypothetical protein